MRPTWPVKVGVSFAHVAVGAVLAGLIGEIRGGAEPRFSRWEKEIAAFERQDKAKPPPKNAVLFVGSSSIRLWNLTRSFPDLKVIKRGFGGSEIADSAHFAQRIVLKYEPRMIVFYAGDNDIANGKSPERVFADFKEFVKVVRVGLPKTQIAFIAIKPSIQRWAIVDKMGKSNALIQAYCKHDRRLLYIDVVKPMLGSDGKPRPELFAKDGLHLSEKGYALWASILRPYLRTNE
jgi:lysophospholipase L1-like esterase